MNNARRKIIREALDLIATARSKLEDAADQERKAFYNLSEGLQQAEQGQKTEEAADALEEAISGLENLKASLEKVVS